ncbi:hypothetical protein [Mucilaginibacter sp. CSA2-8R]|uniref:hypothetical protein n=1 Tax=Mucilaginibacter sp. CSA2-8R TaxID=3141542 RepID=UPI00315C852A
MPGVKISPALKGKYRVVATELPILHHPLLGRLDFRTMTEAQAEQLIAAGTGYLKKVKKRA